MYKYIHTLLLLAIGVFLLSISGCQQEEVIITDPQNNDIIGYSSPLADLVKRTTMNDGSADNIIDNSSCTQIVLPVTVVANGDSLTINSPDDYVLIERIFDASATDVDSLYIIFPITVILPDFTEVLVDNYHELWELQEDCLENGEDPDIECLDFVYPITVSIYDSLNQVSEVVTVHNDEELFDLFESMDENQLASFEFPITVLLSDSTEVVLTNNQQLEDLIESVEDQCDEDDDNDFNDDDIDDSELIAVLMDGSWRLAYFFDGTDGTADFAGYEFAFLDDGVATATLDSLVTEGSWETYGDDGSLGLELDFDADLPLEKLNTEWLVTEFKDNLIEIIDNDSEDGVTVTVHFEKNN